MERILARLQRELETFSALEDRDQARSDLVDSLKELAECCERAEVSEGVWALLQRVLQIEEIDTPFWYFAGSSLLEPYLRLVLLLGQHPVLLDWQINIAAKANSKDLIAELDVATSAFLNEDKNPEHILTELKQLLLGRTTTPEAVMNQIKLEVVNFLAPLLSRLTIPDLKWAFEQSFRNYHSLLLYQLDQSNDFLGSPAFAALFDVFKDKKDLLFEGDMYEKGSSLVLTLLSYYAVGRGHREAQSSLVKTVVECAGGFVQLFEFWKSRFPGEVRREHSDEITGLSILASEIQAGNAATLKFPQVYSGLRRAQYFVPIAGYVIFSVPALALELLGYSLEYLDAEFSYIQTPFVLIGENRLKALQFCHNMIDFVRGDAAEKLRNRGIVLLKEFVGKYSAKSRQALLQKLIEEGSHDQQTAMFVDWYREYMAEARLESPFMIPKRFVEVMKQTMRTEDAVDWLETIHAGATLLRFVLLRDDLLIFKAPEVCITVIDQYLEPVSRELTSYFDNHQDHSKVSVVLDLFNQIREQIKPYRP